MQYSKFSCQWLKDQTGIKLQSNWLEQMEREDHPSHDPSGVITLCCPVTHIFKSAFTQLKYSGNHRKTRFIKRKVYLKKNQLWWRNLPLKTSSKICLVWSPHVIYDLCLHHRLHSSETAASVAAHSDELKFADKQAQCFILSNWDWAELSTRLFILATRHFFQCSVAILQASSGNTANRNYSSHFAPYSPCLPLQRALLIDS